MFTQTWRKHWGLSEDPFAFEDADKDPVLERIESDAVHSSFERVLGNFEKPGPGVVFGEKGSGKSGLRLAVRSRVDEHNSSSSGEPKDEPARSVLAVEYVDFDPFLENLRQVLRLPVGKEKTAAELARRFEVSDHLDAILSLALTKLVDELVDKKRRPRKLVEKRRVQLLVLTALYYHSKRFTAGEALDRMRAVLRHRSGRRVWLGLLRGVATGLGAVCLCLPFVRPILERQPALEGVPLGPSALWFGVGALVIAATWTVTLAGAAALRRSAARAARNVRVLPRDPGPLASLLATLRPEQRRELVLPIETEEATRYGLLQGLLDAAESVGYGSLYVLLDRVDESTLIGGDDEWIRAFVGKLLDHRMLQFPGLALKLFLPIELGNVVLTATSEDLKRMRLDKSNTVRELRWTGQELYEIANRRLSATTDEGAVADELRDLFSEEIDEKTLREALAELGTPRYAFGFLSSVFTEYVRNLPNELEPDAAEWRVPRSHFDVVHAGWAERARGMRHALN